MHYRRSILHPLSWLLVVLACNGADLVLPDEGEPAAIDVVQGDEQVGRVGEPLAEPLIARVTDTRGRPVVDVPVALELDDGADAEVAPAEGRTDVDGTAAFQIVLGGRTGEIGARVVVVPLSGDPGIAAPVRFTAVSADAAGMTLAGGDSQRAPAGSTLPDPLVVQIADVFGNPISGITVAWEVEGGGGVDAPTTTTDPDGRASVTRTLGPEAGTQRTRASAGGLAGSPVTFTHTATAGAAAGLEAVSGNGQSAVVGTPLPEPLVVRLRDPSGNPVEGTAVTWVVNQGGGNVAPETVPTDAQGLAATQWTLGSAVGPQRVTAVVSGVGTVEFTATGLAGTPPGLRIVTQPAATAVRGIPLGRQPVLQLLDPLGADVRQAGVPVTVSVAAGGGRVLGTTTRTTGEDGRAAFTDLRLEGPAGRYTLAFRSDGYSGAVSEGIELARASTTTSIQSDSPDPSLPGAVVRVVFTVVSQGGVPGGTVEVRSEDGATCRAAVSAGACSIALTRPGTQEITAAYEGDAEFAPSSDRESHTVEVPPQPTLALVTQPSGTAVAGVPFDRQPVVQLRDASGNDLRTAGVAVTAGVASGPGTLLGEPVRTTDASGRATFDGLGIAGAVGPHVLRFTASGYTTAASAAIEVQPVPTSIQIQSDSPDPSSPGQPVQVTYAVTSGAGVPSGEVSVSGGGASCTASVAAGGCTLAFDQPGEVTITASFAAAGIFGASSDTESHTVSTPTPAGPSAAASTVTVEPATLTVGDETTIRVTVRDATGRALSGVEVRVTATGSGNDIDPDVDVTNGSGSAQFTLTSSVAETKTIAVVAGGVTLDARPTVTFVRASTSTRIVADEPDPSQPGQSFEVLVEVEAQDGTPTGSVQVSAAGAACTAPLDSDGQGACTLSLPDAGTWTITAEYPGDPAFLGSQGTAEHRVEAPAERVLVIRTQPSDEAVPGEPLERQPEIQLALEGGGEIEEAGVTVRATLASGGGNINRGGTAVTDGNGRARFTDLTINGSEGDYIIVFSADGYGSVSSAPVSVERAATTTEIGSDEPDPSAPGTAVSVEFQVRSDQGTPAGSVVVTASGGTSCSAPLVDGEGSCPLVPAQEGEITLTAAYGGSESFAPSSSDPEPHLVESPNAPPSAQGDSYSMLEDGGPLVVGAPGVLANDQDPDGDALQAELAAPATQGTVTLAGSGGFSYTTPANFSGTATFSYRARDPSSAASQASAQIAVRPVNDPPGFSAGWSQVAPASGGPASVQWATGITPGPFESGQAVEFQITVTEGAELFEVPPAIAPDGLLTYDPGLPGTALVEVILRDDGGTADGGVDASPPALLRFDFTP